LEEGCILSKCIYQITLPKDQDVEAFVSFMLYEYFPAVDRSPTRAGGVTDLALLQRVAEYSRLPDADTAHEFFWHVGWSGVPGCRDSFVTDKEVLRKFESFSARLEFLGFYIDHGEGLDYYKELGE
jgi:hypothetical protein